MHDKLLDNLLIVCKYIQQSYLTYRHLQNKSQQKMTMTLLSVTALLRESKLTQLVRESLCGGASGCCACMIAHVSGSDNSYNDTLQVVQLAAKLYRLRVRRKTKVTMALC